MKEEVSAGRSSMGIQKVFQGVPDKPTPITEIAIDQEPRLTSNLSELDRVLGGGVVPGSVILVGGTQVLEKRHFCFKRCKGLGRVGKHCCIFPEKNRRGS